MAGGDALLHGFGGGICLCLINHICCGVLEDNTYSAGAWRGGHHHRGGAGAGLVLNCLLGFDIWDYSNVPLNLLGQVCLPYSFLWMGISLPAMACASCAGRIPWRNKPGKSSRKKTLTFVQACDIINKRQTWRGVRVV